MTTLLIALGPNDFKQRIGGWECHALSIPFARLDGSEVLDDKGQKLPKEWTELSPEFNGGVVRWNGPPNQMRPQQVTLHLRFDDTSARRAEKKERAFFPALLAVLVPAVGSGGVLVKLIDKDCPPPHECSHTGCDRKNDDLEREKEKELTTMTAKYESCMENFQKCTETLIRECVGKDGQQICTASDDGKADCKGFTFNTR